MRIPIVCLLAILLVPACWGGEKQAIVPEGANTLGPYTPGIQAGGFLFVSGQTGYKDGKVAAEFEAEVQQTFENIAVVMKKAGYEWKDAVAVQVYLTDMSLFQRMNAVYVKTLPEPRPARTTVGIAKLVGDAKIEITVTAWKDPGPAPKKK